MGSPFAMSQESTVLPEWTTLPEWSASQQESTALESTGDQELTEGACLSSVDETEQAAAIRVGYDDGFLIASEPTDNLDSGELPFLLRVNAWGQLRHTYFDSEGATEDLNQFQLTRGRILFSGHTFTPDLTYLMALDARSSSADQVQALDYYVTWDIGHFLWCYPRATLVARAGKYKMPFHLARYLSSREFQFTDRSMASTYFDVNRSLACGLAGELYPLGRRFTWETAIFNGLVTGGAETGSSGDLDTNFACAARVAAFPVGEWGEDALADFECHAAPALRFGGGMAFSTIDRDGLTEFSSIRVVDSGLPLASLLPLATEQYQVALFSVDASVKFHGWSFTSEYYFRNIGGFTGIVQSDLFDHGFWLESGWFVVPQKVELLARWSRVVGDSGTLGAQDESSDEKSLGTVFYVRHHHIKFTFDATYLDGAPISSSSLDIFPGDIGWLWRSQLQFSF
jgi:hypothetical protein